MSIISKLFSGARNFVSKFTRYRELGTFQAVFTPFGSDMYKSYLIRSCIRPIAEHTSKANAVCKDKELTKLLNVRPNMYMNGKDFLYKTRTLLELKNTVFIYLERNELDRVIGLYPVPYSWFEALEANNGLFIRFHFDGVADTYVIPWDDLAVLRKDYCTGDIAGEDNSPILTVLDVINTTNQGVSNAVKATANLRGILKNTKAMLNPEDVKKSKEQFVADYMNLNNEGGIAALDANQEFTPITLSPTVVSWETRKELREDVYRYFGVSDAIVRSDYTEQQLNAFYEAKIEPFLVALSIELTWKCFSERSRSYGSEVIYESNRMQYASNQTKLAMVAMVDRGAMTPNEWRFLFNMAPVEGGDTPIRRLDTAEVTDEQITNVEEKENDPE